MPDSTSSRRKAKWAGVCALFLAAGVAVAFLQPKRPLKTPGPEAKGCYLLSEWLKACGLKETGVWLFQLGTRIENRRVDAAIRSGQLTLLTFDRPGAINMINRQLLFDFGKSNRLQIVMVRFRPDAVELVVDSKGKDQIQAFVRELQGVKAHPPTTAQDSR